MKEYEDYLKEFDKLEENIENYLKKSELIRIIDKDSENFKIIFDILDEYDIKENNIRNFIRYQINYQNEYIIIYELSENRDGSEIFSINLIQFEDNISLLYKIIENFLNYKIEYFNCLDNFYFED